MTLDPNQPYPRAQRELPVEARKWLDEHPEADGAGLEEVWRLTENALPFGSTHSPDAARVAEMRRNILDRITRPVDVGRQPRVKIFRLGRTWAVAASILFAALIGIILLSLPVRVSAPVGELTEVALPDGSEVLLNSGSSLKRGRMFGWWQRSVELEGEAFFDVATASKPFEVHTFNGVVTVLGTQFNVRAWPQGDSPETQVVLTEGSVSFAVDRGPKNEVILKPGQVSRIAGTDGAPTQPVSVNAEALLIWRSGGLAFFDSNIGAVLEDIRRRFGVEVSTSPEIRAQSVSLSMNDVADVASVLDVLAGTHGLSWSVDGDQYRLEHR